MIWDHVQKSQSCVSYVHSPGTNIVKDDSVLEQLETVISWLTESALSSLYSFHCANRGKHGNHGYSQWDRRAHETEKYESCGCSAEFLFISSRWWNRWCQMFKALWSSRWSCTSFTMWISSREGKSGSCVQDLIKDFRKPEQTQKVGFRPAFVAFSLCLEAFTSFHIFPRAKSVVNI